MISRVVDDDRESVLKNFIKDMDFSIAVKNAYAMVKDFERFGIANRGLTAYTCVDGEVSVEFITELNTPEDFQEVVTYIYERRPDIVRNYDPRTTVAAFYAVIDNANSRNSGSRIAMVPLGKFTRNGKLKSATP